MSKNPKKTLKNNPYHLWLKKRKQNLVQNYDLIEKQIIDINSIAELLSSIDSMDENHISIHLLYKIIKFKSQKILNII